MKQSIAEVLVLAGLVLGAREAAAAGTAQPAPAPNEGAIPEIRNAAQTPPPVPPRVRADAATCSEVARSGTLAGDRYDQWILFDTSGTACHIPYPLKQKDALHFAVVAAAGEPRPASVAVSATACTTPSATPIVVGSLSNLNLQASVDVPRLRSLAVVQSANVMACQSDSPVLAVTVTDADGTTSTKSTTLTLYSRTTATLHLGVLYSRLDDPDYGLRTAGGQTVITDRSAQGRGPKYVAMLVVQAVPRYLQDLSLHGPVYPGRDMLHDNEFSDRLGLAVSFGLQDPAKRFGLGLSYELASGINLVGVHEWVKRSTLDGAKAGDGFVGAAADIPVRSEWAKGWAVGLSFDTAYLTNIFTKK